MQNVKTFILMYKQLNSILSGENKRKAIIIAFLSIISALVEMLGISAMLPLVLAILQPETLLENEKVAYMVTFLGVESVNGVVALVSLGVIAVYVLKNAYILWFGRYKSVYRNRIENELSVSMFKKYIYRPYIFFLNHNTAELGRGVSSDIGAVAATSEAFIALFNETLTCLAIGVILIIVNPIIAVSLGIMAVGISLLMIQILRKKIGECGVQTRLAYIKKAQYANEAFGGIKEIDVMRRQNTFVKRFAGASDKAYHYNVVYTSLSMLPSRLTETLFITGLIAVVYVAYLRSDNSEVLVAQFAALAMAAMRVLPSITSISNSMNALVYNREMLNCAYNNIVLDNIKTDDISESNIDYSVNLLNVHFKEELRIDDIKWRYSDDAQFVLDGVSLDIKKGEAIGIIGESGAGKTTLADVILGLYQPQSGDIRVDGKDIYDEETKWNRMIGYVPQNVYLIDDSLKNNILFGIEEKDCDESRLNSVIEKAQLSKVVNNLKDGIDTFLGERGVRLSGGQRQRVAIARALYHNPDILVLDEATSALDNDTEDSIMDAINELQGQITLIIIAHRLSTIANCDKVYEIKSGKAILRSKDEVIGRK